MSRLKLAATCLTALFCAGGVMHAQDRQYGNDQKGQTHTKFDDHDQQVTRDWAKEHKDNKAPAGFRAQDRLTPDEESHLRAGGTLDSHLRAKSHPLPPDLSHRLPPPPHDSHYVAVGGHVAQVDRNNHVQDVIHLELNL